MAKSVAPSDGTRFKLLDVYRIMISSIFAGRRRDKDQTHSVGKILVFAMVAFFAFTVAQAADEHPLRQRVQERWEAVLARDYDRVYAFHTPAYRAMFTVEHLKRQMQTGFPAYSAEVVALEFDAESEAGSATSATATVNVHYLIPVPFSSGVEEVTNVYLERWLLREGEWWYAPHLAGS